MTISITIRNVPEAVRDELAARAARSGRSLQEFLRNELIETASHPDPAEVIAAARERVRNTGSSLGEQEILAHLDAERR